MLFIDMSHKTSTPVIITLLEEHAEPTICFGINFHTIKLKSLRNSSLHPYNGPVPGNINLSSRVPCT